MHEIPEITLYAAAEYLIDEGFHNQIQQGLLSFGKIICLVELSFYAIPEIQKSFAGNAYERLYSCFGPSRKIWLLGCK